MKDFLSNSKVEALSEFPPVGGHAFGWSNCISVAGWPSLQGKKGLRWECE